MTERDYTEALKAEFDMEIQSEEFGFNRTLSIEGSNCQYHDKDHKNVSNDGNLRMDFYSHFSDDSTQNEATTFEHMKDFIH